MRDTRERKRLRLSLDYCYKELTSIENLAIFVDCVHLNSVLDELLSVHFDLLCLVFLIYNFD